MGQHLVVQRIARTVPRAPAWVTAVVVCLALVSTHPAAAGMLRLTGLRPGVPLSGVRAPGPLVWQEGADLVLWDGSTRRQITHFNNNAPDPGDRPDFQWQINQQGQVVWREWNGRSHQIYRWDGANTAHL